VLTNDIFVFIRQVTLLLRRMPISQYGQANIRMQCNAPVEIYLYQVHIKQINVE